MKKVISLFLALSLLFVFSFGCATTQDAKRAEDAANRAEAAAKKAESAAQKAKKSFELQQKK